MPATPERGTSVEAHAMSERAPVPLFVLGSRVFYRPTGDAREDAALIAQGCAYLGAAAKSSPQKP